VISAQVFEAWLLAAAGLALALGYVWGRVNSRRALDRAWNEGYETAGIEARDTHITKDAPALIRGDAEVTSEFLAAPLEPGAYVYPDLAPEVLDAANEQLGLPADVPEPGHDARGDPVDGWGANETARLGHLQPSRYGPNLTPAQRRRDKHKQRGQYAPAEAGHWYAEQLHALADWQAAWHADAAWFDEVWLPGYVEWYGRGLEPGVGLRRILEAAA
jgi:hypothetical protein